MTAASELLPGAELTDLSALRPHPRNYNAHPEDQIGHIRHSIREHGFYRNVVCANDLTILCGHGSVTAARLESLERVPVVRMPFGPDDPRALRLLAGDNEIARLADRDDRALVELLRQLERENAESLEGTGFDAMMLQALDMVTRPPDEMAVKDHSGEWVGMPGFGGAPEVTKVVVNVSSPEALKSLLDLLGVPVTKRMHGTVSLRWPHEPYHDPAAVEFRELPDGDEAAAEVPGLRPVQGAG